MERHITSKGEREQRLLRLKENKIYNKERENVPQIILQGNWVEQRGFEIGCSVSVECYQNKLVILKD